MPDPSAYGPLLNLLLLLPLAGAVLVWAAPAKLAKWLGLAGSLAVLGACLYVYAEYLMYSPTALEVGPQVFSYTAPWLGEGWDVKWMLALDGIGVHLVLLTALLFPLAMLYSLKPIQQHTKGYYSLLLLLQLGCLGVFMAQDMILFYVFFELGLIPAFFLIGIWGGPDRARAGMKFFLYTLAGSFPMLVGMLALGILAGEQHNLAFSSDLSAIAQTELTPGQQTWLFWAFFLGFAVKTPIFPLHTWQPLAYVQAPTAGSALLAGVMSKMGIFGLLRFVVPFFPLALQEYAPLLAVLGVVAILYGGFIAMVQTNLKRLVAYSSLAHMGFMVLGVASVTVQAMDGVVLQMLNHGISTAALFFLVGMLEDRRGSVETFDYQGLARQMPWFALAMVVVAFSSIGVPGLNGFVGEFLILNGSFGSNLLVQGLTVAATLGVIVAAAYLLWALRRVLFGELNNPHNQKLPDLCLRDGLVLLPLVLLMFWLGVNATPVLGEVERSVAPLVQQFWGSAALMP